MTCVSCLRRLYLAKDLWPVRRPLYRPCLTCRAVMAALQVMRVFN